MLLFSGLLFVEERADVVIQLFVEERADVVVQWAAFCGRESGCCCSVGCFLWKRELMLLFSGLLVVEEKADVVVQWVACCGRES